jgi:single-strand DNA-binding protein
MHSIVVAGRLGKDPELKYTPSGDPVAHFSVADNHRDGVTWFRVSAWGRLAEVCTQYLAKGRHVTVLGTLKAAEGGGPRIWTGNDGIARASFEVTASSVEFGDGARDTTGTASASPPDDTIPF